MEIPVRKLSLSLFCFLTLFPLHTFACGGFFCSNRPINQAEEQIVFRQQGNKITTMVQIQYSGSPTAFSWVLPVPGVPDIKVGDSAVFNALEVATRPSFALKTSGAPCNREIANWDSQQRGFSIPGFGANGAPNESPQNPVVVVASEDVGPYKSEIVSSQNPQAMASWLRDNGYDLSIEGEELIEHYIEANMNFLALKLRSSADVGDIRPIILEYEGSQPMIPLKLTAVAAEEDMDILVWLIGESRAVAENFYHVEPNYTRIDWFNGARTAYLSYQSIIPDAIDEAEGQGFITEYAGNDIALIEQLPSNENIVSFLQSNENIENSDTWFFQLYNQSPISRQELTRIVREAQSDEPEPLINVSSSFVSRSYFSQFKEEELSPLRTKITQLIETETIQYLEDSLALFSDYPYLTRLYTVLSPGEMTKDPLFKFKADLAEQPLEREALLDVKCNLVLAPSKSEWTFTLGKGTGRDGEVIMEGIGLPPTYYDSPPVINQENIWKAENLNATGEDKIFVQNQFKTVQLESNIGDIRGAGSINLYWLACMVIFGFFIAIHRKKMSA